MTLIQKDYIQHSSAHPHKLHISQENDIPEMNLQGI